MDSAASNGRARETSPGHSGKIAALLQRQQRGERVKYLFFWGHRPTRGGEIDASCLSQWWPSRFVVDGISYPTAEHYMMAEKARLFGDEAGVAKILSSRHPGEAKALGRQVAGFDEDVWCAARYGIVVRAGVAKFEQNPRLREFLLGTLNRVLVEASPLDRVWGIGLTADDERAQDPAQWRGLNLLGFALMDARAALESTRPPQ
ncbi:NADAR family protein [Streptomyces sclerotialus]|uniref:NADAR family protein n=1 Tax=Streptomyces sclerotialus TaxID=1957 RepID=UPI00099D0959